MKRVHLGRFVTAAFLAVSASAFAVGCQASGSFQAGGGTTPTNAPPPPPPPLAATTAPTTPPPAADPPAVKGNVEGTKINLPGAIVYDTGKATIKVAESEATLKQLKQFLDENPQVSLLRIEGHTDSDGDDNMNLQLSGARSLSVVAWLTGQGVARERLLATGFGESKPIADNKTADGKAQNRRTEFHVAAVNKKPYLGRDPLNGGTVFKLAPRASGPP